MEKNNQIQRTKGKKNTREKARIPHRGTTGTTEAQKRAWETEKTGPSKKKKRKR